MHYCRLIRNGTTEYVGRTYVRNYCTVEGCEKGASGRGFCSTHYARLRRTGTTESRPKRRDLDKRLWDRIIKTDTCWLWPGSTDKHGYGQIYYEGRLWRTHRLVFVLLGGVIPKGWQMDHLCRVANCCNPAHVEPVTPGENVRRAWAAKKDGLPPYTS